MANPTGPATRSEARTVGAYWLSLQSNLSWANRRVASASIVDDTHLEWRTSLDLDISDLRRRALVVGLKVGRSIPVPLATMKKDLQFDLDVMAADGAALSLLTSDADAHIAHAYFLCQVAEQGIELDDIDDGVITLAHTIIRSDDGSNMLRDLVFDLWAAYQKTSAESPRFVLSDKEVADWYRVMNNAELWKLLQSLASAYFMIASVPPRGAGSVIKFRVTGKCEPTYGSRSIAALGLRPVRIDLEARGIGSALREHTLFTAPPGTRIAGASIDTEGDLESDSVMVRRYDENRVVFYTSRVPARNHTIHIDLVPRLGSFFVPALLCSLLVSVLALGASSLQIFAHRFTAIQDSQLASADGAVAILALVPTIFAVFLVQGGEHRFVYRLQSAPRMLLLLPATLLFFCAACVAVSAKSFTLIAMFASTAVVGIASSLFYALVCQSVRKSLKTAGSG